MARIVKTLRNNWKKSTVGLAALSYGVLYIQSKYEESELMRAFCEEANAMGSSPLPGGAKPRQITVLLNPAANRRKAKAEFESYCAPLLNLAGLMVNVIHTEHEGQMRTFLETFEEASDAIVVAGGDGSLSEAVTGLLRKDDHKNRYPIGVLPLGRTNTVAHTLFPEQTGRVGLLAVATMAIIREVTRPVDVFKVQVLDVELEGGAPARPVYCLRGVHWGAFRDAIARQDKYWYWGNLRTLAAHIFTGLRGPDTVSWECTADMNYVLPCNGCSACYQKVKNKGGRWWQAFIPRLNSNASTDYSAVQNSECGKQHQEKITTVDLALMNGQRSCIEISIGPTAISYGDFVQESWRRLYHKGDNDTNILEAREVEIWPQIEEKKDGEQEQERWISIDMEDYALKPIRVTILPKEVNMFCASAKS